MVRWTLVGGLRRCVLRRRARGERQRCGLHGGRRGSASLEHRARRRAVRRHEGEDEGDEQEDTGAPPGDLGEQGRRLPAAHELLGTGATAERRQDRKSTRLNSSHLVISYAVFCLKKKKCPHKVHRMEMKTAISCTILRHTTILIAVGV